MARGFNIQTGAGRRTLDSIKTVRKWLIQTIAARNNLASLKEVRKAYIQTSEVTGTLNSLKQFWPVFNGPYSYRFNADQSFVWPFPDGVRVKITLVGGQGGQGVAGVYSAETGIGGPIGGAGGTIGLDTGDPRNQPWDDIGINTYGYTQWQRYAGGGQNRRLNDFYRLAGSEQRNAAGKLTRIRSDRFRVILTQERMGGAGAASRVVAGSNTYTGPGNAGGRGALPAVPAAVSQIVSDIAQGTSVTIDVGAGGAGNGGPSGASGYVTLQVVDSSGNDFNGPGLPS